MVEAEATPQHEPAADPSEAFAAVVLLDGIPLELGDAILAAANEVLRPVGLFLAGPCRLDAPLPPLTDDRGKTLIDAVARPRPARRVVAVTDQPLRDARGRPIAGQAQLRGRVAVLSVAYGTSDVAAAAAEVAHEVGHLHGVRHCGALGCAMNPWALRGPSSALPRFCGSCCAILVGRPQGAEAARPSATGRLEASSQT